MQPDDSLLRHLTACHNTSLPGGRLRFYLEDQPVGWIKPELARLPDGLPGIRVEPERVTATDAQALDSSVRLLADRGVLPWRGEAFDVRVMPHERLLATLDRGALPAFGIMAEGVHVHGLVRRDSETLVWVGRRAADKLEPGKLDHIVAGGVPAGLTPWETLLKEAEEEAAIGADLAGRARHVGIIAYVMERPEGLRRDRLHCYDLPLPESFTPRATDGEVESFELWTVTRALHTVRTTDDFKFNVNLVLIHLFLRLGLIEAPEAEALRSQFLKMLAETNS
jgi:8-oxo-dGTP pyrophosphatase MutT (NUDIX family)